MEEIVEILEYFFTVMIEALDIFKEYGDDL